MPGRVSSSDGPLSGIGTDQHYVPLDQTTCFLLSFVWDRSSMLFANVCAGVHQFLLWRMLFLAFFGVSCFLLGGLCIWRVPVLPVSLLCTRLGLHRCASCWTGPLSEVGGGITFVTSGRILKNPQNCLLAFSDLCGFSFSGAVYASLGGTAQSPWL